MKPPSGATIMFTDLSTSTSDQTVANNTPMPSNPSPTISYCLFDAPYTIDSLPTRRSISSLRLLAYTVVYAPAPANSSPVTVRPADRRVSDRPVGIRSGRPRRSGTRKPSSEPPVRPGSGSSTTGGGPGTGSGSGGSGSGGWVSAAADTVISTSASTHAVNDCAVRFMMLLLSLRHTSVGGAR